MSAPNTLARVVMLALAAAPGAAMAGELDYTLYTGIEHSDNITLSATDPVSQNVLIPGVNFDFTQQGSTVQANVAGNLEYRYYPGNRFDNQTQAVLSGLANWTLAPQRLDFTVQDSAGVQPVDALASNAPDNQQQTNVLAIGPTLHFRLGGTARGQFELRYIDSYAQKTKDFNSRRGQAALRLFKDIGPTAQLSGNVQSQRITFHNGGSGSNYNRNEAFVRYVNKLSHFDLDAAVGWSRLEFDEAGMGSVSSPLLLATLDWRATERSTLSVTGARQYSDAAQDMLQQPGQSATGVGPGTGTGINTGDAVINSQVYLDQSLRATYAFRSERLTLTVAPLYRKLDYVGDDTFDQTGRGAYASIDYRLRPLLTLGLFADGEKLSYDSTDRSDKTLVYGANLTGQWTPHWSWRASILHQRRDSTLAEQNFHGNEIYFGIVFRR